MALNKKRSLYANDTDGRALDALSKAALIDIVVEFMRCDTDNADIALTADEVSQNNRIKAILAARGDRPLQSAAQIATKANKAADKQRASDNRAAFMKAKWADRAAYAEKIAQQDALLAAHNARLRAEWDAIRAERDARKGADAALMEALNSLGNKR
ncbi:hypothetical protein UFOVP1332_34 [uncultured Caudovirales phage]|uniref:Uncharacterized protein n=1 Tax=uncultured Caudovirales phage TaxID=2100421 RepID=A0A6J5MTT6_9CAUD|nr:hypothetical protein UFOVP565_9 [uncultured Caudovirales phage]CAB4199282.1 hypothetical protein UFOVP1332_34 [uncultured Caudovirales phage]